MTELVDSCQISSNAKKRNERTNAMRKAMVNETQKHTTKYCSGKKRNICSIHYYLHTQYGRLCFRPFGAAFLVCGVLGPVLGILTFYSLIISIHQCKHTYKQFCWSHTYSNLFSYFVDVCAQM